jgi:hypothetical protein
MKLLKDIHKGETGIILGNGKSLESLPLGFLRDPTFGCNLINRLFGVHLTYYTCVDTELLTNYQWEVSQNAARCDYAFIHNMHVKGKSRFVFPLDRFQGDYFFPDVPANWGGSVTYVNLQLAFYMGFKQILMAGIDHDSTWEHFSNDYPVKSGKRHQQRGNVNKTIEKWYRVANDIYIQHDKKIINITPNTGTDAFPTGNYEDYI